MKSKLKKIAALLVFAGIVSACSTFDRGPLLGGGSENFAAGTNVGNSLGTGEQKALATAFVTAMETGSRQTWSARRATGVVEPEGYQIANLLADPRARLPLKTGDISTQYPVETDMGLYVLTRNSNIRKGPGTEHGVVETLPSGSGVEVVGYARDQNWMMIAANGTVRGYVFGNLLIKAPGTDLKLAGGPIRKPILCRGFTQRINSFSAREEWSGAACNDGTGWRLAEDPPMPEMLIDDELLGN